MKSKLLIFCLLTFNFIFGATVKITITSLPANHPFDEDIYIAGDFNTWDPGNQSYKLTKMTIILILSL